MTHRDRVCSPSGRREVAVDASHHQDFSTPSDGLHTRPEGVFTRLLDGVPHILRYTGSPRRALLAKSLVKPSL